MWRTAIKKQKTLKSTIDTNRISSNESPPSDQTIIRFLSDLGTLKQHNPDLADLLSKCDIGNNVGSVYLEFKGYKFFNI